MARLKVDETDFRIIRALMAGDTDAFRRDRVSDEAVARELGLHRNTVSARVKRLTKGRVFLPLSLNFEPCRLGLVAAVVALDVPPDRWNEETLEALYHVEGVRFVLEYVGGWHVEVFADDPASLAHKIELARRLTGASRAEPDVLSERDYPKQPPASISALDARLMAALLEDARRSFDALAKDLHAPARTLRRRYDRLMDEGVLYVGPSGDGAFEGMLCAAMAIELSPSADRKRLAGEIAKLVPNYFNRYLEGEGEARFIYGLFASTLAEIEERVAAVRRVRGVRAVFPRVYTTMHLNPHYRAWAARLFARRADAGVGSRATRSSRTTRSTLASAAIKRRIEGSKDRTTTGER